MDCGDDVYIENDEYPYQIVLEDCDRDNSLEMFRWCCEQWGRPRYDNPKCWKTINEESEYRFVFQLEEHQAMFLLRWR